ncbi:hypothetical protein NM688_g3791 [Phlebia brevispora]|uniref:Uncharacterized protein n=1 Tax=Phlebia brevispora TaxID=194682 RepID=A0ACC1T502_9APHY|nr:hypothetical protein NM688_g3791 [Phlebia brevispora]
MSSYAIVDDQSSRVQYYGQWSHSTVDANAAWDGTVSIAFEKGAGAVFEFHGTEVAVVGGILIEESTRPVSPASFTIDGGKPWTYTPPNSYNGTFDNYLYDSNTLPDGSHTLNVTLLDDGSPWIFDLILYNMTEPNATVAAASSAAASQVTLITTVIAAPTGTSNTSPSKSNVLIGPIVGGIVGGRGVVHLRRARVLLPLLD